MAKLPPKQKPINEATAITAIQEIATVDIHANANIPMARVMNMIIIVFSRPILSEVAPQTILPAALSKLMTPTSITASAKGSISRGSFLIYYR